MCKYPLHTMLLVLTLLACLAAFGLGGALLYLANWCWAFSETVGALTETGINLPKPNIDKVLMLNEDHKRLAEEDQDTMLELFWTCMVLSVICFAFAIFLTIRSLNLFTLLWGKNLSCCNFYRDWLANDYRRCLVSSKNPITREFGSGDFIADSLEVMPTTKAHQTSGRSTKRKK